jgi:hypothetical protein
MMTSQLLVTAVYDVAMYKRRAPSFLGSFDSDTRTRNNSTRNIEGEVLVFQHSNMASLSKRKRNFKKFRSAATT